MCIYHRAPQTLDTVLLFVSLTGFQYVNNGLSLVVASVAKSHEGNFTCVSTNVAGTDSDDIQLYVQGKRENCNGCGWSEVGASTKTVSILCVFHLR